MPDLPGWSSLSAVSKIHSWTELIGIFALIVLVFAEAITWVYGQRKDDLANAIQERHEEDMTRLHVQLQTAKKEAATADANLLTEQRLTASERMRLARLERAVLPRTISPEIYAALVPAIRGLGPVNIAVVKKEEPLLFALQLMRLFSDAGIMGRFIDLPPETAVPGDMVYAPNQTGERLAQILWARTNLSQTRIGGRSTSTNKLSIPDLSRIPTGENCLVIGDNDAAMSPPDGQPGEGVNEQGRPVPEPQH